MMWYIVLYIVTCVICTVQGYNKRHAGQETTPAYQNEWLVKVVGPEDVVDRIARELGYENNGKVLGFNNVYRMVKRDVPAEHQVSSDHHTKRIAEFAKIEWVEQQFMKKRDKRDLMSDYAPSEPYLVRSNRISRYARNPARYNKAYYPRSQKYSRLIRPKPSIDNEQHILAFNDELWDHQWYMHDTRSDTSLPELDLDVMPVYLSGVTGKNVTVTILDDGIEGTHSDLKRNFDPSISYDINDDDADATPQYNGNNAHGTRCAGEVAMAANNGKCGVGIAFDSKIGGIRMLDGKITDKTEGAGLGFNHLGVDIYSASWGPTDNGKTVEGPGRLATEALIRGVTEGRAGKGVIYVWASGNGGLKGDSCSCDGYVSSIYTLAVGSATQRGAFPWYGEMCASTLTTTYSSGAYTDQKIVTTDVEDMCTVSHTGTSAAAPLAAGIIALALEANPSLSYRDVKHLIVWTSDYERLKDNPGWKENNVGLRFNSRFGFGVMTANKLVQTAKTWINVPNMTTCETEYTYNNSERSVNSGQELVLHLETAGCEGDGKKAVTSLEYVELCLSIAYSHRGSLTIQLTSPKGTETTVLYPRSNDASSAGFHDWRFTSAHTWGEDPRGTWTVNIKDSSGRENSGTVTSYKLILHGTATQPKHMKTPRQYETSLHKYQHPEDRITEEELRDNNKYVNFIKKKQTHQMDWNDIVGSMISRRDIPYDLRQKRSSGF